MMTIPRFLDRFSDRFSYNLAIDLGSTNTLIYQKGSGIVVNEPSVIAFDQCRGRDQIVGIGASAKELLCGGCADLTIVKPVQYGAVADFKAAHGMLQTHLKKIRRKWFAGPFRVIANVPALATQREKAAIRELIKSAGADEVYLIEEPRALALGAGLDLSGNNGHMVIDIGGEITEMAVLAGGNVVSARSIKLGGEHMDQAIVRHVRKRHNLKIGSHLAEKIKIEIGEAYPDIRKAKSIGIAGVHIADGRSGSAELTGGEISEALSGLLKTMVKAVKAFLNTLSPKLHVDIMERGIALAGGAALLGNVDRLLERELMLPLIKVKDPLTCLVLGTGDALNCLSQFREIQQG